MFGHFRALVAENAFVHFKQTSGANILISVVDLHHVLFFLTVKILRCHLLCSRYSK